MKHAAIPIETKVRELDGKIWFALNLVERGYKVALGRQGDIHYTVDLINPDIYVEKSADYSPKRLARLKQLNESGTIILVLDAEGGVFPSDQYYYSKRLSKELLSYVDQYLAWGEGTANIIKKHTEFPLEQIAITGNPRFDLLQDDLKQIYKDDAQAIQEEFGDYILFNTKFGISNNKDSNDLNEMLKKRGRHLDEERFEHNKNLLQEFLSCLSALKSEMNSNIVIRPHPSEDFTTYEDRFSDSEDVYVRHEGDVRAWIYGSRAVVHNSCTTGIESALLKVPVYTYRPVKNREYDSHLPNFVSKEVQTERDLIKKLQMTSQSDQYKMTNEQRQELKRYFYNIDTRAVDEICTLIDQKKILTPKNFSQFRSYQKTVERTFKQLPGVSQFKDCLGTEGSQKFPGLSRSELRERVNLFNEFVDCDSIVIESIAPWKDAYWLYDDSSYTEGQK